MSFSDGDAVSRGCALGGACHAEDGHVGRWMKGKTRWVQKTPIETSGCAAVVSIICSSTMLTVAVSSAAAIALRRPGPVPSPVSVSVSRSRAVSCAVTAMSVLVVTLAAGSARSVPFAIVTARTMVPRPRTASSVLPVPLHISVPRLVVSRPGASPAWPLLIMSMSSTVAFTAPASAPALPLPVQAAGSLCMPLHDLLFHDASFFTSISTEP